MVGNVELELRDNRKERTNDETERDGRYHGRLLVLFVFFIFSVFTESTGITPSI